MIDAQEAGMTQIGLEYGAVGLKIEIDQSLRAERHHQISTWPSAANGSGGAPIDTSLA